MLFKEYNKWVSFEGEKSLSSQIQAIFFSILLWHWYTVCDLNLKKNFFNLKPPNNSFQAFNKSICGEREGQCP